MCAQMTSSATIFDEWGAKRRCLNTIALLFSIISSVTSYYNPSFQLQRTNTDSTDSESFTRFSRPVLIYPTGGYAIQWVSISVGSHRLYNANTGDSISPSFTDPAIPYSRSQVLVTPDKGFVGVYDTNETVRLNIQTSNGGNTFTFSLIDHFLTYMKGTRASMAIPSTLYVIRSDNFTCDKLDFNAGVVITNFTLANPGLPWYAVNYGIVEEIPGKDSFYASMRFTITYVLDSTTLVRKKDWIRPSGTQNNNWTAFRLDNINSNDKLYILDDDAKKFYMFNHTGTTLSQVGTFNIPAVNLGGFLQNFGPLQYIFSILINTPGTYNSSMLMLSKTLPVIKVDILNSFTSNAFEYSSAAYYNTSQAKIIFGMTTYSSPFYFMSYKLDYKICLTRDAGNVCTLCAPDYYFSNTSAGNDCWFKSQFPVGVGANDVNKVATTCTVNNCYDCIDNYQVCMSCKSGYYWTERTAPYSNCYDANSIPSGYGKNGASFLLEPCNLNTCFNCSERYDTCVACSANIWYQEYSSGNISNCYDYASIPNRTGIDGSNFLLKSCSLPSCEYCKDSYTDCKNCQTNHYFIGNEPGTKTGCYLEANIPNLYGKNGVDFKLLPCSLTGCKICSSLYSSCNTCDDSLWYKEADPNLKSACYDNSARPIPDEYGKDGSNKLLKTCTTTSCKTCTDDYNTCTACFINHWQTEHASGNISNCYNYASIPSGLGKDGSNLLLKSCSLTDCDNCKDNYQECIDCKSGYYFTGNNPGIKSACYASDSIPLGKGKNSPNYKLESCSLDGCLNCSSNYLTCDQCDSGMWYKESDPTAKTACYDNVARPIPEKYGKDGSNMLLKSCTVTTCEICSEDYNTCTKCYTGNYYTQYLSGNYSGCYVYSTIPSGLGIESGLLELKLCSVANCSNCKDDFNQCKACSANYYFTEADPNSKSQCYSQSDIPATFGRNGVAQKLESCSVSGCYNCSDNFNQCVSCDPSNWFKEADPSFKSGCYDGSTRPIPAGYGKDGVNKLLKTCQVSDCQSCASDYTACSGCPSNTWYLSTPITNCLAYSDIPSTHGIDGANQLLQLCSLTNCGNCTDNYAICIDCKSGTFYTTSHPGTKTDCYQEASIPAGYGKNGTSQKLELCNLAGCDLCPGNYSTCKTCSSGNWYLEADPDVKTGCYDGTARTIPSGYGKQSGNMLLKKCNIANCLDCAEDYQSCVTCIPNTFYPATPITICYNVSDIPSTKGIKSGTQLLETCSVTSCDNCSLSYTSCQSCLTNKYHTERTAPIANCYASNEIPFTYGINGTSQILEICSIQNCKICSSNYLNCDTCSDNTWYKESTGNKAGCYLEADIPEGFGKSSGTFILSTCSVSECGNCRDSYDTCVSCKADFYYKEETGNKLACYSSTTIPSEYGINGTSKLLTKCSTTGCDDCKVNYQVCQSCLSDRFFKESSGEKSSCYQSIEIPSGYGIDGSNKLLKTCTVEGCIDCAAAYTTCSSCDSSRYVVESSAPYANCYTYASIPADKGIDGASKTLKTCTLENCNNCTDAYTTCMNCKASTYYTDPHPGVKSMCYVDGNFPPGYGKTTGGQKLELCTLAGCTSCTEDYTTCGSCEAAMWYKEADSAVKTACYDGTTRPIPDGYGKDGANKLLKQCTLNTCKVCTDDYNICNQCPDNRYYTATPIAACYLYAEIPTGKGRNSNLQLLETCTVNSCDDCKDKYTECQTCISGTYFKEETLPKLNCYLQTNIPLGYGIDGANQLLKPCSVSNCNNCSSNHSECLTCDTSTWHVEPSAPIFGCYISGHIPNEYGKKTGTAVLSKCNLDGCLSCQEDYMICMDCKDSRYYMEDSGAKSKCYAINEIPSGYGVNGTSKKLASCTLDGCSDCRTDVFTCDLCENSRYFKEETGPKSQCYTSSSIPVGYGVDGINQLLKPCSVIGCSNCQANFTECKSCDASRWFNEPGPLYTKCFTYSEIPDGWGKDGINPQLVACTDLTKCLQCKADYQKCETCQSSYWYIENAGFKQCYLQGDIPAGYGKSGATTKALSLCSDVNCLNCTENYSQCIECKSSIYYITESAKLKCYKEDSIPERYGKSNNSLELLRCNDTHCRSCTINYSVCTQCDSGWIPEDGECLENVSGPRNPGLISVTYDTFDRYLYFRFTTGFTREMLEDIVSTVRIVAYIDSSGKTIQIPSDKTIPIVKFINDGFAISINLPEAGSRISLIVDGGKSGYLSKETRVEDIVYTSENSWLPGILLAISISLTVLRIGSMYAMSYFHKRVAVRLDKIIADILCLLTLSGQLMGYTSYVMRRIVRFTLWNPWNTDSEVNSGCSPTHSSLDRKDIDCNILSNFGEDLLIIYVTLFISAVIQIVGFLKKTNLTEKASKTFGLSLWMQRMDAILLQVLIYTFIQMKYTDDGKQISELIGYCLTLLAYYLLITAAKVWATLKMYKNFNDKSTEKNTPADLKVMSWIYSDCSHPSKPYQLLLPLVNTLRSILLSIIVVFSLKEEWVQAPLILLIESSYLAFILKSSMLSSKIERVIDYISSGLFISYTLTVMGSNISQSDSGRQNGWGTLSLIAIMSLGLVNVGFVVISVTNSCIFWIRNKNKSSITEPQTQSPYKPPSNETPQQLKISPTKGLTYSEDVSEKQAAHVQIAESHRPLRFEPQHQANWNPELEEK